VPEGDPSQRETEPEGSAGRFDDASAREQVAAFAGAANHMYRWTVFDPTGVGSFELGPETPPALGEW